MADYNPKLQQRSKEKPTGYIVVPLNPTLPLNIQAELERIANQINEATSEEQEAENN